jgi:predicted AAA+ superfamily ATPase
VNLLAGRAITRQFFPLTGQELQFDFDLDNLLAFGSLPGIRSEPDDAVDLLEAYVDTYLREEIMQEALVREVTSFSRFLEVAAIMNGQVVNTAGIARDAGVARPTVARFFDILVDTLIGFRLPAWRPRARVRETQHPKFYFFDTGVTRGVLGRLRNRLESAERGPLLETLVLHELRAAVNAENIGGNLSYWRTPSGVEVDFIWERGRTRVGIEVKASARWRREDTTALATLLKEGRLTSAWAVYTGRDVLRERGVNILPVPEFMRRLSKGGILRATA